MSNPFGKAPLQFQFSHQVYQQQAVDAVVKVFDGQPLAVHHYQLTESASSVQHAYDGSVGNQLLLTEEQLLANVQAVQRSHGVAVSDQLLSSRSDDGKEPFCPYNFSIEMETGTGKTYTFIRTVYELHKVYGFLKFVVAVPSVAIREGTVKNLQITRPHFAEDYGNEPCRAILYDSGRLNELESFARSSVLSILVINIDSFSKDSNKINQKGERAFAPIDYIRSVNPIVIVDEPQNFETDARRRALAALNPLCTLRYSATHRNAYNLLYSLNPVRAYDLGLVKQIEVDGVQADEDHNQAFVELLAIEPKARGIGIKVRVDVNGKQGVERKAVSLKLGDDLHRKSNGRDSYADGYILNEVDQQAQEIVFSGGRVVRLNEPQDGLQDEVMRFQIERTVAAHFARLKQLKPRGIKVLSLFFIDKVANYRSYDADGNPVPGKFAQWFEAAFTRHAAMDRYRGLIVHPAGEVHNGYFSGDRKGKGAKARVEWVDTKGDVAKDESTYALIMQEKERLLSLEEPLQFIFSHSALREGWDNPNVFQICTLNETHSPLKKRQEIGRGLRLCVDQQGQRVQDKQVNVLTVIPNESYEQFARSLQQEIEEETGVSFQGRVKDARAKARLRRRKLDAEDEALFRAIWARISYRTRYRVRLDTPQLVDACVSALSDLNQYPKVQPPRIHAHRARLLIDATGVRGQENSRTDTKAEVSPQMIPDVYAYIQNRVHLTRTTLFAILDRSARLEELLVNPQAFLDMVILAIRTELQALLVEGIEYHRINGQRYEMTLFDDLGDTYLSSLYPQQGDDGVAPLTKTLLEAEPIGQGDGAKVEPFACVPSDSDVESQFARDCSNDERVKFFFKLPGRFRIATPLGSYNPDWAVVFEGDSRIYFVAETKSSTVQADRRQSENLKIACGRKHFALADDVSFRDVSSLQQLAAAAGV